MIEPTGLTEEKIYAGLDDWKDAKQIMRETKIPAASCRTYLEAMRKKGLVKKEEIDGHEMWNRATGKPPIQKPAPVNDDQDNTSHADKIVKAIKKHGKPLNAETLATILNLSLEQVYRGAAYGIRRKMLVSTKKEGEKSLYWLPEDKKEEQSHGNIAINKEITGAIATETAPTKPPIHIPEFVKHDGVDMGSYNDLKRHADNIELEKKKAEGAAPDNDYVLDLKDALTGNNLEVTIEVEGKKFHAIGKDKIVLYMLDLFLDTLAPDKK